MKRPQKIRFFGKIIVGTLIFQMACTSNVDNRSNQMKNSFKKGTYGFDREFFAKNNIQVIELKNPGSEAAVMLLPGYQGRVMTSTDRGNDGKSFGWINYSFIEKDIPSAQFNPYGGEERLWLGPEGGPFSIYFKKDAEQVFSNWLVPKEIDTEAFEIVSRTNESVKFQKDFTLTNASGTEMNIGINRSVTILDKEKTESALKIILDDSLTFVAYESENILINKGQSPWTASSGVLSVWMLAMLNPSPDGVVFIPFKNGSVAEYGKKVTDDYFGKVPSDRLIVTDSLLFFKIDGKFRSKIGISPERALPYCGSYDPESHTLTILWYSAPDKPSSYVNSKWGEQSNPLQGDVVNSYNDGPVDDGSVMGPFYEIESSSPAAFLSPGEKIIHKQRIFHIAGDEKKLDAISLQLFNLRIDDIKNAFK